MNAPSSFRRAFTLMELLLCVALIAVLTGLLFSVVGRVRSQLDETQCLDQLRKIGGATALYVAEHQGSLFPDKFFYTPPALGNYLDLPAKTQQATVFTCPTLKRFNGPFPESSWHQRTYSINNYILPSDATGMKPRRLQQIQEPQKMILIADGVAVYPGFSNTITPAHARDLESTIYPHRKLNHALFLDGHVGGLDYETMSQPGTEPIWGKP